MVRTWTLLGLLMAGMARAGSGPVDFSLPDVEGKQRSLAEFRGKWVVVNYWATWCPPCLEEMPDLQAFHDRHADKDAVVLGVNFEDIPQEQLKAFVDENFISYPVLRNGDMSPAHERLAVGGLPTTYIISPEGVPVARQIGTITGSDIERFMEKKSLTRSMGQQGRGPAEVRP
ncbi:MAG TPA: TlpA disulfide reductase family protein [Gammaproteobacteria bacterium]